MRAPEQPLCGFCGQPCEPLDAVNVGCAGLDRWWHRHACPRVAGSTTGESREFLE